MQFLVQLMIAEGLFLCRLERKKNFWIRLLVFVLIMSVGLMFLPTSAGTAALIVRYIVLFIGTLIFLCCSFTEDFQNLLFCGIAGYTVAHLAYLIFSTLDLFLFRGIDSLGVPHFDPYSPGAVEHTTATPFQLFLFWGVYGVVYVAVFFLVYIAVFDLFDPLIRQNKNFRFGRKGYISLSGALILFDVVSNVLTMKYTQAATVSYGLELGYNIMICLLILFILYGQIYQLGLKDELTGIHHLMNQGKLQYELAKKSSEMLNIKYHDLRHRASASNMSKDEQLELNKVLSDYDARIETGNETLDVILTEKNLQCKEKAIQLICMADGKGLVFMKAHHLYALLGNALENAMEAVQSLPVEERCIHLYIQQNGNFFFIRVENPFRGELMMRSGVPLTSKPDMDNHGYGLPSMKAIVEMYGGNLSVKVEDHIFTLEMLLVASK
ncbi:MAG: ATP-binding protein [Lachnospiraceae bacterium]|nr:ATP-binding protein [Lachnospiraceae bacterium]